MSMIDLDALEAKARAADDGGTWSVDEGGFNEHFVLGHYGEMIARVGTGNDRCDARSHHIAAFDPPTALALIARIRELEAALEKIANDPRCRDLRGTAERAIREAARSSKEAADGK